MVLTGPRQSGKTTLLQRLFAKTHRYVSFDLPDVLAAAASDPRGFLQLYPPPVIFDEIQYAPGNGATLLTLLTLDEPGADSGQPLADLGGRAQRG